MNGSPKVCVRTLQESLGVWALTFVDAIVAGNSILAGAMLDLLLRNSRPSPALGVPGIDDSGLLFGLSLSLVHFAPRDGLRLSGVTGAVLAQGGPNCFSAIRNATAFEEKVMWSEWNLSKY
jgi:hypothetical protein